MRWIRYEDPDSTRPCLGQLEGDTVLAVEGDLFGDWRRTGATRPLAGLRLLPPVIPPTFYAAGVNYRTHFVTAAQKAGKAVQFPTRCDIGYRAVNALAGHEDTIRIPRDSSGKVQFEGELVVVIGRRAKHLRPEDALDCVFGYTLGNDVSERTWQASDRTFWRGKNCDSFKPMGPWIDTDFRLDGQHTTIRLNGQVVSRFATGGMLFGITEALVTMTRYLTLVPGDVVWMGTDDPTLDMVPGDVVEVEIDGLGMLRNPVAFDEEAPPP